MPKGRDRLTPVALALAVGVLVGWSWPGLPVWWLVTVAAAIAVLLIVLRRWLTRAVSVSLLLLGAAIFGAAWPIARHYAVGRTDLARYVEMEPTIARLRGVVTSSPQVRYRADGSMEAFNYQPPWLVFELDAKALVDRHGEAHHVSAGVWVSAPIDIPDIKLGDVVELAGRLRAPARPQNPGEFDIWRFARAQDQSAVMRVDNAALVNVILSNPHGSLWITRWRDALRARATAWLHADMPDSFLEGGASHHRAVLNAILIGERAPELHEVGAAMQRTGIAHLMAISGLHLGILVGLVLLVLGAGRDPRPWHGVAAILLILVYLMLVEVRVPVLRAGVMLMAASLGIVLGRRVAIGGLIGLSMIAMLLIAPAEVSSPGFQLSFGVVYAIVFLAPRLRERWFGRPNLLAGATGSMVLEWLKTGVVVAVVAWLVATPIVLYHFGIVSPLGVPLSVIGVPAAGVVLALGYSKIVLSAILPSAGLLVGALLAGLTEFLIWLVLRIDELPGASVELPMPGVVWTCAAIAWVVAIIHAREKRTVRALWAACAALVVWLLWPMLPVHARPALRVDMLAVGDGSCYVIRAGGETMVFDAGTMGHYGAGLRVIVPAMRRLGVRGVDTVVVSHANLDHFSAMTEVVVAFGADELLVTPQFLAEAERDPDGPAAVYMANMRERDVALTMVSAGAQRTMGACTFDWLHPAEDAKYERANDTAMVVRITCGGRRVLMTGDIQSEAIEDITARVEPASLRADVLELPHHGGYDDDAAAFVRHVAPAAVLQSTGSGRLRRDHWADELADVERFITARDGACWIAIEADGEVTAGRFLDGQDEPMQLLPAR